MNYNIDELFQIALNAATEAKNLTKKYILNPKIISNDFKDIKTMLDYEMNAIIILHYISH